LSKPLTILGERIHSASTSGSATGVFRPPDSGANDDGVDVNEGHVMNCAESDEPKRYFDQFSDILPFTTYSDESRPTATMKDNKDNMDISGEFERLFVQDNDEEWEAVEKKVVNERKEKYLTITAFLVACGLNPDRSYFKQLCCFTARRLHPSKRRNSPGREYRDAVTRYFAGEVSVTSVHASLETTILEWCLDNRLHLRASHISAIHLIQPGCTDVVVYAYRECTLSNSEILDMLLGDVHIADLAGSTLRITSRCVSQLL
jgi:hypothetical protein